MKNNNLYVTILIAVVIGAAAFFGGMKFQETKATTNIPSQFGQNGYSRQGVRPNGSNGNRMFNGNGRASIGKVLSTDNNSITLKLQDGSSKIINISDSTKFTKTDTATKNDIKTGEQIAVFGTTNSDGSVDAQNVQLNPEFRQLSITGTPGQNR